MHALVHAADVQDRDGGVLVMAALFWLLPFLLKLYADGGYQGPEFRQAAGKALTDVNVEIVKRSDQAKGFVVLPRRWVVERTFAWLCRCRRLAKDWECLSRKALAFLRLASIRLRPRKLCNQHDLPGPTLRESAFDIFLHGVDPSTGVGVSSLLHNSVQFLHRRHDERLQFFVTQRLARSRHFKSIKARSTIHVVFRAICRSVNKDRVGAQEPLVTPWRTGHFLRGGARGEVA